MHDKYVWGYHLAVDCGDCDRDKITSKENIEAFSKALVERIDMKAYGEPIAVHFAEHDPGKAGFTLVQLIETSNICAHFVDATGECYLDVFSCKDFDTQTVLDTVAEFFNPKTALVREFERGVVNG